MLEHSHHALQLRRFLPQLRHRLQRKALEVFAGVRVILPQEEQFSNGYEREPEAARLVDKCQRLDAWIVIRALPCLASAGQCDQLDPFVVADHLARHAGLLCGLPNIRAAPPAWPVALGYQRRNSKALPTTHTLLSATAPPATGGIEQSGRGERDAHNRHRARAERENRSPARYRAASGGCNTSCHKSRPDHAGVRGPIWPTHHAEGWGQHLR